MNDEQFAALAGGISGTNTVRALSPNRGQRALLGFARVFCISVLLLIPRVSAAQVSFEQAGNSEHSANGATAVTPPSASCEEPGHSNSREIAAIELFLLKSFNQLVGDNLLADEPVQGSGELWCKFRSAGAIPRYLSALAAYLEAAGAGPDEPQGFGGYVSGDLLFRNDDVVGIELDGAKILLRLAHPSGGIASRFAGFTPYIRECELWTTAELELEPVFGVINNISCLYNRIGRIYVESRPYSGPLIGQSELLAAGVQDYLDAYAQVLVNSDIIEDDYQVSLESSSFRFRLSQRFAGGQPFAGDGLPWRTAGLYISAIDPFLTDRQRVGQILDQFHNNTENFAVLYENDSPFVFKAVYFLRALAQARTSAQQTAHELRAAFFDALGFGDLLPSADLATRQASGAYDAPRLRGAGGYNPDDWIVTPENRVYVEVNGLDTNGAFGRSLFLGPWQSLFTDDLGYLTWGIQGRLLQPALPTIDGLRTYLASLTANSSKRRFDILKRASVVNVRSHGFEDGEKVLIDVLRNVSPPADESEYRAEFERSCCLLTENLAWQLDIPGAQKLSSHCESVHKPECDRSGTVCYELYQREGRLACALGLKVPRLVSAGHIGKKAILINQACYGGLSCELYGEPVIDGQLSSTSVNYSHIDNSDKMLLAGDLRGRNDYCRQEGDGGLSATFRRWEEADFQPLHENHAADGFCSYYGRDSWIGTVQGSLEGRGYAYASLENDYLLHVEPTLYDDEGELVRPVPPPARQINSSGVEMYYTARAMNPGPLQRVELYPVVNDVTLNFNDNSVTFYFSSRVNPETISLQAQYQDKYIRLEQELAEWEVSAEETAATITLPPSLGLMTEFEFFLGRRGDGEDVETASFNYHDWHGTERGFAHHQYIELSLSAEAYNGTSLYGNEQAQLPFLYLNPLQPHNPQRAWRVYNGKFESRSRNTSFRLRIPVRGQFACCKPQAIFDPVDQKIRWAGCSCYDNSRVERNGSTYPGGANRPRRSTCETRVCYFRREDGSLILPMHLNFAGDAEDCADLMPPGAKTAYYRRKSGNVQEFAECAGPTEAPDDLEPQCQYYPGQRYHKWPIEDPASEGQIGCSGRTLCDDEDEPGDGDDGHCIAGCGDGGPGDGGGWSGDSNNGDASGGSGGDGGGCYTPRHMTDRYPGYTGHNGDGVSCG